MIKNKFIGGVRMSICPTFSHLAKGREQALEYVSSLEQLESTETYTYKLNHLYDSKPCDIYVKTLIQPVVFELLLAKILFVASDVEESHALGQEEIAQPVLNGLYGVEVLNEAMQFDKEFDLYYVWEKWCGKFTDVMNLGVLKHEQLHDELAKIVPID